MKQTITALQNFDKQALIGGAAGAIGLYLLSAHIKMGGKKLPKTVRFGVAAIGLVVGAGVGLKMAKPALATKAAPAATTTTA